MNAAATPLPIPWGGPTTSSTTVSRAERHTGHITASFTAAHLAAGRCASKTEMPSQRLAQPHTPMMVTLACKAAKTPRASGDRSRDVSNTVKSPEPATAAREITTEDVRPRATPARVTRTLPAPARPRASEGALRSDDSIELPGARDRVTGGVELGGQLRKARKRRVGKPTSDARRGGAPGGVLTG